MSNTKFTVHNVRELFNTLDNNRIFSVLNTQKKVLPTVLAKSIPFIHRSGVPGTMLVHLNQFDIDDIIQSYEDKLLSPNHKHLFNKTKQLLVKFNKIKSHIA